MPKLSVVIPNYNGLKYLEGVLESLERQTMKDFEILLVDNGSVDKSCEYTAENYPRVRQIRLEDNYGFCKAVNEGIKASNGEYVLLLNNDVEADPSFVLQMYEGIRRHPNAFSCQAKMLRFYDRDRIDDAGNYYCALGWAYARGKGSYKDRCRREEPVFATCAGAAIYRKSIFEKIGYFDEEHFAYLEDTDIGYRARIYGYENWFLPEAIVYHVGSGTSGSRYNQFKTRYSSRNNIYMIYKNMPFLQILLNLPLLLFGFGVKLLFFSIKGLGSEYAAGIKNGFQISRKHKKCKFQMKHCTNYMKIQLELWGNVFRRFFR